MTPKIVVAKPGFDALTETNPDNLIYSSDYDSLKYHISGTKTVSVASTGTGTTPTVTIETVAHGLNYAPFFIAYIDRFVPAGGYSVCPGHFAAFTISTNTEHFLHGSAYVDSTNIYFKVLSLNSATGDFVFPYKIFRNRLGI